MSRTITNRHTEVAEQQAREGAISPAGGKAVSAQLSAWDFWWAAGCIGLIAGYIEVIILLFRREALERFIWTDTSVVWTAPTSYVLLLAVVAAPISVLYWKHRRPVVFWFAAGLMLYLAVDSLLLVMFGKGLHSAARIILAIGAAVQVVRLARTHLVGFRSWLRWSTPALLVWLVACGFGLTGWNWWRERRAVEALPQASAGAPNVLVIVLDAVRAPSMSLYGYPLPTTPKLAQFGKQGVVFERAIAPSSWTLPSHASIFTGLWPHELQVGWMLPLKESFSTLAESFQRQGYVTGAFTANFFYTTRETGLAQGFQRFDASAKSLRQVLLGSMLGQRLDEMYAGEAISERRNDRKTPDDVTDAMLRWVDERDGRPFFAFLNYFDAHKPYLSPPEFQARFASAAGQRRYLGSVAYLDEKIGELLADLEARQLLDNTITIITADHGELLGEHGRRGHGTNLYLQALHIPLIIMWPRALTGGVRVKQPVSSRDIAATVAELVGLKQAGFPGNSLSHYWRADTLVHSTVLSMLRPVSDDPTLEGGPPMYSLVDDSLHYIRNADGSEELYHYRVDPTESATLADRPELNHALQQFRSKLREFGLLTVPSVRDAKQ